MAVLLDEFSLDQFTSVKKGIVQSSFASIWGVPKIFKGEGNTVYRSIFSCSRFSSFHFADTNGDGFQLNPFFYNIFLLILQVKEIWHFLRNTPKCLKFIIWSEVKGQLSAKETLQGVMHFLFYLKVVNMINIRPPDKSDECAKSPEKKTGFISPNTR